MNFSDITQGLNEWNGNFYTNSQFYDQVIEPNEEIQRERLADAISYASNSPDGSNWDTIYNSLNPYDANGDLQIKGGNVDFTYSGDPSLLSFVPASAWPQGCETTCRYGSYDAIHFNNGMFHLDTAGVTWGFGLGALAHFGVDIVIGNINPGVPIVH